MHRAVRSRLDISGLKNFRPVSNLSFLSKLLERVVQIRLPSVSPHELSSVSETDSQFATNVTCATYLANYHIVVIIIVISFSCGFLQVNAVYQRCERDVLATCNCGVMVRSGDDVLVIDRCVRRRHRMPPPLDGFSDERAPVMSVLLYLNGKLTPGTRVHQLADGRKYIVSSSTHHSTLNISYQTVHRSLKKTLHCSVHNFNRKFIRYISISLRSADVIVTSLNMPFYSICGKC